MNIKLTPTQEAQNQLHMIVDGRKVLYIMCEENSSDIAKRKAKIADRNKTKRTAVVCTNNSKRYESILEASIELNLDPGAISRCISNKQKTTKGFGFKKDK